MFSFSYGYQWLIAADKYGVDSKSAEHLAHLHSEAMESRKAGNIDLSVLTDKPINWSNSE